MAIYSVHFFCNECSLMHPLGTYVTLKDGPEEKVSLSDFYQDREMPREVAAAKAEITHCLEMGMLTSQEDDNYVFLVPMVKVKSSGS